GALHPVVAGAADRLAQAGAHVDHVVARAAEDLRLVVAGDDEVVAFVALQQVERTGAAADGVVAGTALHDVVAEGVGEHVVAGPADVVVVAGAAFHPVVARVAGQRVVAFVGDDDVAGGAAVPDHVLASGVAHGAVGQHDELTGGRERGFVDV